MSQYNEHCEVGGVCGHDHRRLASKIREMTSPVAHFTRAQESVKFPYSSFETLLAMSCYSAG